MRCIRPAGITCEHNPDASRRTRRYNDARSVSATTSATPPGKGPDPAARQARPGVAKLRLGTLSLRARLALLVALAVAVIIGVQAVIEINVFERTVEHDLRETARLTALAVADDFELRAEPVDYQVVAGMLHDFTTTAPSLRAVSIVGVQDGRPSVLASTSSNERPEALRAAQQAVASGQTVFAPGPPGTSAVAVPAYRDGRIVGAAVATVSLASVAQLRTKGRRVTLWFAPAVVLLLTIVIDWFTRRLFHQPISGIHTAMARVGEGDFGARAPVVRPDEIGAMAASLNDMLARLQDLNDALQERVAEATAELRVRNQELVESYQRVFALREALGRAEQMAAVGQMAASVAHQVGTPLNLISGYVQMMQEEATDPRTARRLASVQEQIGKVASVVRTMLDHARRPDARRPVAIGTLLQRVADVVRPKLDESRIALKVEADADLPLVEADSEELELALLNLVNNSLDAMPAGGTLSIAARSGAGRVRIDITDSGAGVPASLLPRIFEPWVTTKPPGRGTGLGLSITRDVIARHGGGISAASEPGCTTFTIDLPAAATAAETLHAKDSDRR